MLLFPKKTGAENPVDWLPKENWNGILKMAEMETFTQLPKDIEASPNRFKDWFNSPRPEATPMPLDWRKLDEQNPFAKLLIVRAMRPDRMLPAVTDFVRTTMPRGERFTEVDSSLSFADVLDATLGDSTSRTPIFFILSSGADPMIEMVKLAQRNDMLQGRYWDVSMGQGQDKVAMKCLEQGARNGDLVLKRT
jgi:dynein heavy chain